MRIVAAIGVLVLALAASTTAGATTSTSPGSYVAQYVALYDQLAQIVQSDKGNCTKMVADLKSWAAKNRAKVNALQAAAPKISTTAAALAALKYEKRLVSDATKVSTSVLTCASNPKVAAALASGFGKLKKP